MQRGIYINVIGSGKHEGYNLPAYVDFAIRSDKFNYPNDGSVKRFNLPRSIFKRSWGLKFFGSKIFKFTNFNS